MRPLLFTYFYSFPQRDLIIDVALLILFTRQLSGFVLNCFSFVVPRSNATSNVSLTTEGLLHWDILKSHAHTHGELRVSKCVLGFFSIALQLKFSLLLFFASFVSLGFD